MSNYRIKDIEFEDGLHEYIIQERIGKFFWKDMLLHTFEYYKHNNTILNLYSDPTKFKLYSLDLAKKVVKWLSMKPNHVCCKCSITHRMIYGFYVINKSGCRQYYGDVTIELANSLEDTLTKVEDKKPIKNVHFWNYNSDSTFTKKLLYLKRIKKLY